MIEYKVLLADPPWKFGDRLPGKTRGAERNYHVMPTRDICAFCLPLIAADAILFLWRVAAMQQDALDVIAAWGFRLKSEFVWVKTRCTGSRESGQLGMGRYVRHDHEVCLIAVKGRGISLIADHGVRSVVFAPRGKHSAKPEESLELIEQLTGGAQPRVELFARRHRPGWVCMGNEVNDERRLTEPEG